MPEDQDLAIRVILLPKDTNEYGTIFGGVILSQIDLAGAVEARRHTLQQFVTVAMKKIEFHEPVFVGDVVSFYARTLRIGTTSITIHVEVYAERKTERLVVKVTEAEVIYVAVDKSGRKMPVRLLDKND